MRYDLEFRKEEILTWIKENRSKAYICRELKCKPSTLENYLNKWSIVYKGNKGNKNWKISNNRKKPEEYLIDNSTLGSHKLKLRLLRDGVKQYKCEKCCLGDWLGQLIPLELHHKDGNKFNNLLERI